MWPAFTQKMWYVARGPKKLPTPALDGTQRPYPLRFHVVEAGADVKLIQHGQLGVAYHRRHPISTIPVARITAHAMVHSFGQVRLRQVWLGQVRLGQARLGQVRLGQIRLGQVRIGKVRLGQVRLGQVRLGQVRLGQARLGQVRIGKTRLGLKKSFSRLSNISWATGQCSGFLLSALFL